MPDCTSGAECVTLRLYETIIHTYPAPVAAAHAFTVGVLRLCRHTGTRPRTETMPASGTRLHDCRQQSEQQRRRRPGRDETRHDRRQIQPRRTPSRLLQRPRPQSTAYRNRQHRQIRHPHHLSAIPFGSQHRRHAQGRHRCSPGHRLVTARHSVLESRHRLAPRLGNPRRKRHRLGHAPLLLRMGRPAGEKNENILDARRSRWPPGWSPGPSCTP